MATRTSAGIGAAAADAARGRERRGDVGADPNQPGRRGDAAVTVEVRDRRHDPTEAASAIRSLTHATKSRTTPATVARAADG